MAHSYDVCPETRLAYDVCTCALCAEAKLKTQILLNMKGKEIPQWLIDATGVYVMTPEQARAYWRMKEWL